MLLAGRYREKLWSRAWKCIFKTSVTVFPYTDLPAGQYHKYINGRSHHALFVSLTIPEAKKVLKRKLRNL